MTVTASTATIMMMMLATAVTTVAAAVATVTTTTATSLTAQAIDEALYLVLGGLAALYHLTGKAQGLACKGMVKVHLHLVVGDLQHTSVESVAILILKWHYGIDKHILMVEMSVDAEHITVKAQHTLCLMVTIGMVLVQFKLKVCSCLQFGNLLFKVFESHSKTT